MTVNENIRRIRLEKGMTQKQVAEACGTVDAAIRTYELGKANPKPATVAKIARALGVSPAELYGRDDPNMAAAIYQSESGGVVDADAIYLRRISTSLKRLNNAGKEEAAKRVEELAYVPTYSLQQTAVNIFNWLTEGEQSEILAAYQSLENAKLEKAQMEANPIKGSAKLEKNRAAALESNARMIEEKKDIILNVVLAALERSKDSSN